MQHTIRVSSKSDWQDQVAQQITRFAALAQTSHDNPITLDRNSPDTLSIISRPHGSVMLVGEQNIAWRQLQRDCAEIFNPEVRSRASVEARLGDALVAVEVENSEHAFTERLAHECVRLSADLINETLTSYTVIGRASGVAAPRGPVVFGGVTFAEIDATFADIYAGIDAHESRRTRFNEEVRVTYEGSCGDYPGVGA